MVNKTQIYSVDNDFGGTVFAKRIHQDINKSSVNSKCIGVSINVPNEGDIKIEFEEDLSVNSKSMLDDIVSEHKDHWLQEEKKLIYREIDKEIEHRIRNGFEYPISSNQYFSLSVNAQIKWAGLLVSKDMMSYPLRVPTIDDNNYYDIQDINTVIDMWQQAMITVRQHISDGTITKENIKSASTSTEVNTIKNSYFQ